MQYKMTFHIYQSYILGILCISLILVSGLNTNFESPIEELFTKECLIGAPGPPQVCCVSLCPTYCPSDCNAKGFTKGGFCTPIHGIDMCCCKK
ncbi:unnamed protein product [Lathyrus oleraceus]